MAKRVYFGFHYQDVIDFRANVVRNHWVTKEHRDAAGFFDASLWEEAENKGDIGLKRLINSGLDGTYADEQQRVYRGIVDTPKSHLSVRWAALSDGLLRTIQEWRQVSIATAADHWVFPSEKMTTPLAKDNCWRRHVKPKLEAVGLGWVDFHVMRRTHSCLLKGLDVGPKVRADQMGTAWT